jgi:hypothetical protein
VIPIDSSMPVKIVRSEVELVHRKGSWKVIDVTWPVGASGQTSPEELLAGAHSASVAMVVSAVDRRVRGSHIHGSQHHHSDHLMITTCLQNLWPFESYVANFLSGITDLAPGTTLTG